VLSKGVETMRHHDAFLGVALLALASSVGAQRASAQAMLADDIIILSKGQREQEKARTNSHLGPTPGAGERPFRMNPGGGEPRLGETPGGGTFRTSVPARDVLSAASSEGQAPAQAAPARIAPPSIRPRPETPIFGPLEIPAGQDEGPPNGLTLDMAIDRLVQANYGLRTKFQELPKAQADILSAGLRANPLVFASADGVPYGNYSPRRPAENGYSVVLIQPIDVNRKRLVRVHVAEQAKRVLEAQYQDAVRLEIDNLYTSFVDVLDARETVRYARASLEGLNRVLRTTEEQYRKELVAQTEVESAAIQRDAGEVSLEQAETSLRQARRALALLLDIPMAQADRLEIRGSLRDVQAPPPSAEDLAKLALCVRPDLVAYRLGVRRAQADVTLQRAERFPDVFVLYTPYGFQNNAPVNAKSATSWSIGAMVSIPLFNRNQGNIRRAEHTVLQTRIELSGLERLALAEVERASLDYTSTRAAADRLERGILPRARRLRDQKYTLYTQGQENIVTYLNAQREYNEVVRQYRDALIRHRRSMLRLNTAVGQRVLP
jgi:cobalt-zinc-cadmium efflux system outer membrane protein